MFANSDQPRHDVIGHVSITTHVLMRSPEGTPLTWLVQVLAIEDAHSPEERSDKAGAFQYISEHAGICYSARSAHNRHNAAVLKAEQWLQQAYLHEQKEKQRQAGNKE